MAENHIVDAKDQHIAAEGVADHSDLVVHYKDAKKEDLGPWMQEADRQKALEEERYKIHTGLRKSSLLIGLSIGLPVALGILLEQYATAKVTDMSQAGPLIFTSILLGIGFIILTIILLKWVGTRFQKHSIRALPITVTTLLCLLLVLQKIFDLFDGIVGGLVGYALALVSLICVSIIISTVSIFVWTSPKLPWFVKLGILAIFIAVSSAIFYLA